ncbi:MAG: aminoacetone oxidase family FAD-binding enzyme [Clostridium sp.]|nr:aminoacetone oxidase family FAD-binding enzyme [Acetatifactor muris]MCM1527666.1 aminoacetone oxidase family FAD-binding enzyme [Bacteroides sp.]MCM1563390.1 aminoacetone oxidase family FAD-binding enzyme [Clostridium sp.]
MSRIRIGVVGAGAAGMTAALTAAEAGAEVTLLESGERVGRKILSTGNGKCNLGNPDPAPGAYRGADKQWLADCLGRFGAEDTIRFFAKLGLLIKEKNGGLYPVCEQAAAVLDAFRAALRVSGLRLTTCGRVQDIHRDPKGGFAVRTADETYHFDRVILACGGKAAPKTGSDGSGYALARGLGHTIVPVVPALVQLRCRESYLKEVAGVRADARISVVRAEKFKLTNRGAGTNGEELTERGELQLTDYGVSGIPVFQLSREVNYMLRDMGKGGEAELSVNLLPDLDEADFEGFCADRKRSLTDRTAEEFFTGIVHKKLMYLFLKLAGISRDTPVKTADERKLAEVFALCRDWRLHVTGSNSFDNAQVCAGGVDTAEVTVNMESRRVPGLYFAGEILDVDGRCGGYNLHWAWCSGYLAGNAAAGNSEV